jgi:hypothetical protein
MSSKKNLDSIKLKSLRKLSIKQDLLLNKIKNFFKKDINIKELLQIVEGKTKLSLRIIDWFVTNYSKKNVIIIHNKKKQIDRLSNSKISPKTKKRIEDKYEEFNVHLNYKSQLKSFQKKQFDPFCRRQRINFYYTNDKFFVTTVGQLNFFKWAIENNILDFIRNNIVIIEKDMNQNIKKSKSLKNKNGTTKVFCDNKTRQKRRELSNCATKTANIRNTQIILDFD